MPCCIVDPDQVEQLCVLHLQTQLRGTQLAAMRTNQYTVMYTAQHAINVNNMPALTSRIMRQHEHCDRLVFGCAHKRLVCLGLIQCDCNPVMINPAQPFNCTIYHFAVAVSRKVIDFAQTGEFHGPKVEVPNPKCRILLQYYATCLSIAGMFWLHVHKLHICLVA